MRTQVFEALRARIVRGHLLPRTPLNEKELAEEFGVSRTPVREAILRLGDAGLVDIFPQAGTFVSAIKMREVLDNQFVREALETAAVAKAAAALTPYDAEQLSRSLELQRFLQKSGDTNAFFAADEDLHERIFAIAGHVSAWSVVGAAKQQLDRVRHLAIKLPQKRRSVIDEHVAVVEALIAQQADRAVEAMRLHMRGVFATLDVLSAENTEYFATDGERPNRRVPLSINRKIAGGN